MSFESISPTLLLKKVPFKNPQVSRNKSITSTLHMDVILLLIVFLLMVFGLVVLYSATNGNTALILKQIAHFIVGLFILFILAQMDVSLIWRYIPYVYALGVISLVITHFYGISINGSQRWINVLGVFRFQPSEIMKILVPIMVVWVITQRDLPPKILHLLLALGVIILPAIQILLQPDLGTAIIICGCGFIVLFLAGISYRLIGAAFLLLVFLIPLAWFFVLHDYHKRRIITFLNPESDPLGAGWNVIQSLIAIGSGGLTGKGWTEGTQATLGFLPESHTDFIFSVLSEDFGLAGCIALVMLYTALVWRGLYIARVAQQTITRLVAASLIMIVSIYMFVNIAMVSSLLPVVGVPLPFISYGGTSAVSILSLLGIIMSIATHKREINR